MRKILIVFVFLSAVSNCLWSQVGFNKTYHLEPNHSNSFRDMVIDNDTIIIYSVVYDSLVNQWGILLAKIDTFGSILDEPKIITDSSGLIYTSTTGFARDLIKTKDGGYALFGGLLNSNFSEKNNYLMKFHHNGDLDFVQYYPKPDSAITLLNSSLLEISLGGYFLLATEQRSNYKDDIVLIRTNSTGDELWRRQYGEYGLEESGNRMIEIDANTFVIGGGVGAWSSGTPDPDSDWIQSYMLAVDSLGVIKWEWQSDSPRMEHISDFLPTDDGGWVYASNTLEWYAPWASYYYHQQVIKLNSSFEREWVVWGEKPFISKNFLTRILKTTEGYIVSGSYDPPNTPQGVYGIHIKVSFAGDSLWTRIDSAVLNDNIGVTSEIVGTGILSTGSIVSCGHSRVATPKGMGTVGWLIKISPDGCVDTLNCWPVALEESIQFADYQLSVYPNPASDVVHFSLSQDVVMPKKSEIVITDILGRKVDEIRYVRRDVRLDVRNYPQGLYFYRLEVGGRVLDVGKILVE